MKGKDLLQKRNKDEESLYLAMLGEQQEIYRLNDSIAQFRKAVKEHKARLNELENITPTEWRKKNENQG